MAKTSKHMSAAEKRAWAQEFDRRVASGAKVRRRGGMKMVDDDRGNSFQRNGNACPGRGYDRQATYKDGQDYDKPPQWSKQSQPKQEKKRGWFW